MAEEIELLQVQENPVEEGARIDAHIAEEVAIDTPLLSSSEKNTDHHKPSPFTIRRVPANIREYDHAAYNPRIVSIGPFHRGRENLQAMEEYKWRFLRNVLASGNRNTFDDFREKMKEIETQARNCYYENIIQMNSDEFVEMMVLDGCFLIYLFVKRVSSDYESALILDDERMWKLIFIDMLLLENQLPFFVLECLWEFIGLPRDTLRNEALKSFQHFFSYELELNSPEKNVNHLLHLLHLSLKPDSSTEKSQTTSTSSKAPQLWNMIPSATELQEAGVRFQLKPARSFFEVTFERGLMEMPCLWIDHFTNILFRNFIAFEQCFPYSGNHFTTYCSFIHFLVDTPRDVSILREADIIRNGLGISNEEVALLFNKLGKEIVWSVDRSYLADLFEKVFRHTHKRWPKWRAKLVRDYCACICILIASVDIILILTFLGTYFTVFAYFKPPKP